MRRAVDGRAPVRPAVAASPWRGLACWFADVFANGFAKLFAYMFAELFAELFAYGL